MNPSKIEMPSGTKVAFYDRNGYLGDWPSVTGEIEESFISKQGNGRHYVIRLTICALHPTRGVLIYTTTAHEDNLRIID